MGEQQALREQIARIIDPGAWRVMDGYLADMLRKYGDQHAGYDPEAFKHKGSLAKADAVLALLRPVVEALKPFAAAHDERPDINDQHPDYDRGSIWESSSAMTIEFGHLRRASEALKIAASDGDQSNSSASSAEHSGSSTPRTSAPSSAGGRGP